MFTQAQVRLAVGLSIETIRHWRKTLPVLRSRSGRAAMFSFGDLVALASLRCLAADLGIGIGELTHASTDVFDYCNRISWLRDTGAYLVIGPRPGQHAAGTGELRANLIHGELTPAVTGPSIVIPLEAIVERLRSFLFAEMSPGLDRQAWLPFPPIDVPLSNRPGDRTSGKSRRPAPVPGPGSGRQKANRGRGAPSKTNNLTKD